MVLLYLSSMYEGGEAKLKLMMMSTKTNGKKFFMNSLEILDRVPNYYPNVSICIVGPGMCRAICYFFIMGFPLQNEVLTLGPLHTRD